jgi:nodulation protein E
MNRVVVAGIGVVSPVGCSIEDFWSALVEGRSAIGQFSVARSERLSTRIAAQVSGFDPAQHFEPRQLGTLDRFSQFAVVAARAAVRDSGLELSERLALETATVVGNASAGQTTLDDAYFRLYFVTAQVIALIGGIDRSRRSTSQRAGGTAERHRLPR